MDKLISRDELREIMPHLSDAKLDAYLAHLNAAMARFEINTADRIAAFIAQVAHESDQFRFMKEIWGPTKAQRGYEGRRDLGNTQAGDGRRFQGRGPIQVTGRDNYTMLTKATGTDYVSQPELLEQPEHGFIAAAWFWAELKKLNALADNPTDANFILITRRINGGTNGLAERQAYWETARRVLRAADLKEG